MRPAQFAILSELTPLIHTLNVGAVVQSKSKAGFEVSYSISPPEIEVLFAIHISFGSFITLYTRYNIRELFETYAHVTDSQKVKSLIARGWKDLETFQQLSKLEEETIKRIFVS